MTRTDAAASDELSFLDDYRLTLRQKLFMALAHTTGFSTAELVAALDNGSGPSSLRTQVYLKLNEMEDAGQVAGRYEVRENATGKMVRVVVWRRVPGAAI